MCKSDWLKRVGRIISKITTNKTKIKDKDKNNLANRI